MPTSGEEIEACAEALIFADLRDWQQIAALQSRLAALGAEPRLAAAAQGAAAACDALFADDLDASRLAALAADLGQRIDAMRRLLEGGGEAPEDGRAMVEFLQRHLGELDELAGHLSQAGHGDGPALEAFRRGIHTLKGDAGLLGLGELAAVCHGIEDAARDPQALPVDALLKALDWAEQRLICQRDGEGADELPPVAAVQAWMRAGAVAARQRRESGTGQFEAPGVETADGGHSPLSPASAGSGRFHADPGLALPQPLPAEATPEMAGEFLGEVHDHLERIEAILLGLDGAMAAAEPLNALFRSFHTIKGLAGFLHLQREQTLAHAAEDLLDRLREGSRLPDRGVVDLLFAALDGLKQLAAGLAAGMAGGGELEAMPLLPGLVTALRRAAAGAPADDRFTRRHRPPAAPPPLGELLVRAGAVPAEVVRAALAQQEQLTPDRRLGEILVDAGMVSPAELGQALARQRPGAEAEPDTERGEPRSDALRAAAPGAGVPATMRVDVERVDVLNDAIGELVIAQNMLSCSPDLRQLGSRRVAGLLAQLDRVTRSIQDMAMRLRLVSVRPVFQRMIRLGRDAGRKLGKEVEVAIDDGGQELDKSVVDRLGDPLLHLVRNAVDHGIEPDAQARAAAGKARCGRVALRAFRTAGSFCVEVQDDGRGLDHARILAKAVERGLVREHQQLSEEEIAALLFLPGFSTAERITEVSGRGVGMDVVKRMVEEMRGQVAIRSQRGRGTTVSILLPMTLAIIDGMLVRVGGEQFILPTLSVVTSTRPREEDLASVCGRSRMVAFQGHQIPLVSLHELLRLPEAAAGRPLVVVVEDGLRRVGLAVDELLGRQQVVLKALGSGLPPVPGIGGATINGDGRVCLVLDVAGLVQLAGGP